MRTKDLDLDRNQLVVRAGKGGKDRVTVLPKRVQPALTEHLERLRLRLERERAQVSADERIPVSLPDALAVKNPALGIEWRPP